MTFGEPSGVAVLTGEDVKSVQPVKSYFWGGYYGKENTVRSFYPAFSRHEQGLCHNFNSKQKTSFSEAKFNVSKVWIVRELLPSCQSPRLAVISASVVTSWLRACVSLAVAACLAVMLSVCPSVRLSVCLHSWELHGQSVTVAESQEDNMCRGIEGSVHYSSCDWQTWMQRILTWTLMSYFYFLCYIQVTTINWGRKVRWDLLSGHNNHHGLANIVYFWLLIYALSM